MDKDRKPQTNGHNANLTNIKNRASKLSRLDKITSQVTRTLMLQDEDSVSFNQSYDSNNSGVEPDRISDFLSIYELKDQRDRAKGKQKTRNGRKLTVTWSLSTNESGTDGKSGKGRRKSSFGQIRRNYKSRKSTYRESIYIIPKPPSLLERFFCIGARQRKKSSVKRRLTNPEIEELLTEDDAQARQASVCEMQILPQLETALDEADVVDFLVNRPCKKNPGHPTFIPIRLFEQFHLPYDSRNNNMWKIIQDQGLRTVKLTVYYTTDRPGKFDVGVAAGSRRGRFGTGWVELFDKTIQNLSGFQPGKTFVISTAAHVIFDKKEAKETKVEFFFDDDQDRGEVIEARGVRLVLVNSSLDVCRFMCRTKDAKSGFIIGEKLRMIPKYYPPVPPIENIAWCVSHPHGMAQRLTIGRVKEIVEEEPTWSCNVLKLLVYQCTLVSFISEKKVFYVFFKDSVNGINLYLANDLDEITRLEHKSEFLRHLIGKGMVEKPNDDESKLIKAEYNSLIGFLVSERDEIFIEKWTARIVMSPAKLKEEKHLLFKQVVHEESARVPVIPNFQDLFNTVEKELWLKKHEILFGTDTQKVDLARTKSIIYSLDSCPGSSGARVTAYLMTNEGLRRYMGHHSRGLKDNQGNMCGGGGSRLVPTIQPANHLKKNFVQWVTDVYETINLNPVKPPTVKGVILDTTVKQKKKKPLLRKVKTTPFPPSKWATLSPPTKCATPSQK